jgi:hypothetical protein
MTRFAGYRLLGCPSCQAVHAVANLVSFNLMSFETWTDGQKLHALVDHRQGVRQCTSCDGVFLERDATFMGTARTRWRDDDEPYEIPAFLLRPANEPVWTWQRLLLLLAELRPEELVVRAELHRELGEFTEAVELLSAWNSEEEEEETNTVLKAAKQQVAAPLPVAYAWQGRTKTA